MASEGIISSIPCELITEILYRLPSKSVGRFRCVSKEWLSLLSSPQFIKIHQNTLNNLLFLPSRTNPYFIPFHYHEEAKEEEEEESVPTTFYLQVPDVNLIIYGSCNGLVLLSAFTRGWVYKKLMVSNPTTREFVEIPVLDFEMEGHKFVSCIMCELGYDSVTDDYKVVTINHFVNNLIGHDIMSVHVYIVHVYSLRRNTWTRVIDYPDKYFRYQISSTAFVNGSFHWVATKVSDQINVTVAFSLANENFSEVPSPMLSYDVDISSRRCVVDEKLAIFSVSEGEVWIMNEYKVKGSWTKIKLHGLKEIPMLYLSFVFSVNGELVLVCDKELLIYDIKDGRLSKRIDISGNTYMRASNYECICVESLVSPRFYRLS